MKLITDLRDRVAAFNEALENGELISEIVIENRNYLIETNADKQLYEQGINNLGIDIDSYAPYSPVTVMLKEKKGQPTNRVTLRDTGAFENSFYVLADREQFEIKANDWKTEELIIKYGYEILGLTQENLNIFVWEYIYPGLMSDAKKYIYGNR